MISRAFFIVFDKNCVPQYNVLSFRKERRTIEDRSVNGEINSVSPILLVVGSINVGERSEARGNVLYRSLFIL